MNAIGTAIRNIATKTIITVRINAMIPVENAAGAAGLVCCAWAKADFMTTGRSAVIRTVASTPATSQYQEVTSVSARAQRFARMEPIPNVKRPAAINA